MYFIDDLEFHPPFQSSFDVRLKPRDFIHASQHGQLKLFYTAKKAYDSKDTFKTNKIYTHNFSIG
jgi:hypothetical protein